MIQHVTHNEIRDFVHRYPHSPDPPFLTMQLQSDVDEYGPVLAILVVIGGLDTRPRLGGLVHHEELGPGTVVKIEVKSKVVVLFHGRKAIKSCNIGAVKAVSVCACACVVLCVSL